MTTIVSNNVFDYFVCELGAVPDDQTLAQLGIETNCGKGCKKAIDAAKVMLEHAKMAGPHAVEPLFQCVNTTIETFWHG